MDALADDPIRICIGTEPRMEIPRKVLEFSIRKHAGAGHRLEFHPLVGGDWQGTGPDGQYTGFSLLRWTIAETFRYSGKAIYVDPDQLCLTDIAGLWNANQGDDATCVWCTYYVHRPRLKLFPLLRGRRVLPESSVMLIDCERARGRLHSFAEIRSYLEANPTQERYDEVMHLLYLAPPPGEISPWWNVMDGRGGSPLRFLDARAKIIHFTRVPSQPWYAPDHPACGIWESFLAEALDNGDVTRAEIETACDQFSLVDGRPQGMHPYWKRRFAR